MEKCYTLYYDKKSISKKMTIEELIDKLDEMQLSFHYYPSIDCLIIFEKNYWYRLQYENL